MNHFLALPLAPALHEEVIGRVHASVRKYGFVGRPLVTEHLHVSLLNFSGKDPLAVKTIAASVQSPPFEIRFDAAMSFRNTRTQRHPFVLTGEGGLDGVRALHRVLYDWFHGDDPGHPKVPAFNPHLTLLYDRKLVPKHALARPLSWMVRDFVFHPQSRRALRYPGSLAVGARRGERRRRDRITARRGCSVAA